MTNPVHQRVGLNKQNFRRLASDGVFRLTSAHSCLLRRAYPEAAGPSVGPSLASPPVV